MAVKRKTIDFRIIRRGRRIIATISNNRRDRLTWYNNFWNVTGSGYLERRKSKYGPPTSLHRLILKASPGEEVDHFDRNPFNNSRDNIRRCEHIDNCRNRASWSRTGVKGVYITKTGKYQCSFNYCGERRYFGQYDDLKTATEVSDIVIETLYQGFAYR